LVFQTASHIQTNIIQFVGLYFDFKSPFLRSLGISGIFQGCCDFTLLDSRPRGNDGGRLSNRTRERQGSIGAVLLRSVGFARKSRLKNL
jgi:hypothetical protein